MHLLIIFTGHMGVLFSLFLAAVVAAYVTIQFFIKFELEGYVSRGLYTFTAIFGSVSLLGALVMLGFLISYLA